MKKHVTTSALTALCLWLASSVLTAQEEGVYIIFDASGSMWGELPDKTIKIEAAREVLKQFVKQDFTDKALALRAYGHNRENDCSDTELVVPFSSPEKARARITTFAKSVIPKGRTPISRSLRAAIADFGERSGEIILISDGLETCGEDPCELVRAWRDKDIAIRIHVVGLGLNKKEKASMKCISEAAGTEYLDAQSAEELSTRLKKIHSRVTGSALIIRARTSDGRPMKVSGVARSDTGELSQVASNSRNRMPPGKYALEVGVETRNGNLYKPVSKSLQIGDRGETLLEVVVQEPPSVKARFVDQGQETKGSMVTAFQNNKEVLSFRWMDRIYLNPGTYEFRTRLNPENELSVSEAFAAGDHKEVVFQLVHTVHAKIKMVASGSGIDFRENYELWRGGKKVKNVHWSNGVQALPGVYDLHLPNPVTPYTYKGMKLTEDDQQSFRITIPCGHVTVIYQDASGKRDKDVRCWIHRKDGDKWIENKTSQSGRKIPLVPGSYRLKGWDRKGKSYDLAPFTVIEGDEKEVILRDKG